MIMQFYYIFLRELQKLITSSAACAGTSSSILAKNAVIEKLNPSMCIGVKSLFILVSCIVT